jgi:hypothetical protein
MNVSPSGNGQHPAQPGSLPWDLGTGPNATLYELKLDLNDDFVEDITWRFTFSDPDPTGEPKYVRIAELTGPDATSRTAPGRIITPPNAPVGQVLNLPHGIKAFTGERLDSFFTDIRVPARMRDVLPPDANVDYNANPDLRDLPDLHPFMNTFAGHPVRLVMVELPAGITGLDPIQCWGSTAIFDKEHGWYQVQRAAGADTSVVFDNGMPPYLNTINGTGPSADLAGRPANPATDPAPGTVWGTVRDQVAAVVKAMGNFSEGKNGQPTAMAYGAWVADTLLPNVLRYTPGTTALWDPWNGVRNGKGLHEELASNFARMVTNTDFTTGLKQQGPLLDHFPYLAPPSQDS